ncbi:protein inturned-like [Saccoglossus kowalevskii]|uniref:Protein inturned n=1 Tax=Saccoglossus kowalevskii TaxID=10224 RepID=A0ABM0M4G6_SACKO|nr:PREDICTED: protein inturned-like [Saccoglossus kowalevskii]
MTHQLQGHRYYNDYSSSDSETDYPPRPRIIVGQGDADRRWETESGDGLEPAWAGAVQDKGDVFYVEQGEEPPSPKKVAVDNEFNSEHTLNGKGKEKRGLHKLKKIIKGRKGDNGKLHVSLSEPDLKTSQYNLVYGTPDKNTDNGDLREVSLFLSPDINHTVAQSRLEALFGIIPGRFSIKSRYSPLSSPARKNDFKNGDKIMVRGLLPTGVAMKSGQISIGDCVVAINGIPLNYDNFNRVLSAIVGPLEVKLHIEKQVLPKDRFILQPRRILPNGSLVKLVSGEKLKEITISLQKTPHVVMYLSIAGNTLETTNENKEVLYQYPENEASRKLSDVQGMFLTVSDMMETITGTRVICSSIVINKQLLNVGYYKNGTEVLVLAVPANKVSVSQLNHIVSDVVRLLILLYGSLDNTFLPSIYQAKLDHLFSLLFQRLLLGDNVHTPLLDSNTYAFLDTLPGVRWLDLPDDVKVTIDSSLSELEATDFADMSDDHYDDRRPYVILGTCLFHRGYLLANHLPKEDFIDMLLYCRYHSLLTLASEARIGQLVIWKEVYPTRRRKRKSGTENEGYTEPHGRDFLLIVGMKNGLLCMLLEAGGCAAKAVGNPSPDPFYVDQAKATLLHLESISIPASCEDRLSNIPVPAISCADWFFSSKSNTIESSTPPPIPGSPMLSRLHTPQQKGSSKKQQLFPPDSGGKPKKRSGSPSRNVARSSAYEVDSDEGSDASAYSPVNSQQSTPVLRRRNDDNRRESVGSAGSGGSSSGSSLFKSTKKHRIIPDPFNMAILRKGLNEAEANELYTATKLTSGADNTLFHYVNLEIGQGVVVCPTHKDVTLLGGTVHPQLIKNFHKCCLGIRQVFHQSRKPRLKSKKTQQTNRFDRNYCFKVVKEHGILMQCTPENWNEQKKSPPTMNYWVVGRIYGKPFPREVYVCFHESAPQNTIELAFKLSFGAGL